MPCLKGRYWLLTIPVTHLPNIPEPKGDLTYIKGQQELGEQGLHHWQLIAQFKQNTTLNQVKSYFCKEAHCELTRSAAADDYVWKEQTAIPETRFEKGNRPIRRNNAVDWETVRSHARLGNIDAIEANVYVQHYTTLKRIAVDHCQPEWRPEIKVMCYWGGSGLGKTRRAWFEAGENVYIKDPCTKWWDGYRGQENVIIDEFTGTISINHILRWLDRYPCLAEVKGYSTPLRATNFWITSNVDPNAWYTDANSEQVRALRRRMDITHFITEWKPPRPENEVHWDESNTIVEPPIEDIAKFWTQIFDKTY